MHELLQDPTIRLFAFCAAILVLKMILTGSLVGFLRIRRGVYITPEDYLFMGKAAVAADETIERVRRAHQNDLEQILPFLVVALPYSLSGPPPVTAWWLFGLFTVARLLHTGTYLAGLQPWRSIFFEVGNICLVVMSILLLVSLFAA